jgi:hypothetical protein
MFDPAFRIAKRMPVAIAVECAGVDCKTLLMAE